MPSKAKMEAKQKQTNWSLASITTPSLFQKASMRLDKPAPNNISVLWKSTKVRQQTEKHVFRKRTIILVRAAGIYCAPVRSFCHLHPPLRQEFNQVSSGWDDKELHYHSQKASLDLGHCQFRRQGNRKSRWLRASWSKQWPIT